MINSIIEWLVNLISSVGYWGVGLAMFIESFFAPIPSEIILPFSGFVASKGNLNILIVIIVATIAAYFGSLPFYFIGKLGEEKVLSFLKRFGKYLFISDKDLKKGIEVFEKFGNRFVLLGRLIPIIRTVISFPAGVSKMNFGIFSLYTIIGTAIWSTILSLAGFFLGSKWENVSIFVARYEKVIIGILLFITIVFIGNKILKRKNTKS